MSVDRTHNSLLYLHRLKKNNAGAKSMDLISSVNRCFLSSSTKSTEEHTPCVSIYNRMGGNVVTSTSAGSIVNSKVVKHRMYFSVIIPISRSYTLNRDTIDTLNSAYSERYLIAYSLPLTSANRKYVIDTYPLKTRYIQRIYEPNGNNSKHEDKVPSEGFNAYESYLVVYPYVEQNESPTMQTYCDTISRKGSTWGTELLKINKNTIQSEITKKDIHYKVASLYSSNYIKYRVINPYIRKKTGLNTAPTGLNTAPTGLNTAPTGLNTAPTGLNTVLTSDAAKLLSDPLSIPSEYIPTRLALVIRGLPLNLFFTRSQTISVYNSISGLNCTAFSGLKHSSGNNVGKSASKSLASVLKGRFTHKFITSGGIHRYKPRNRVDLEYCEYEIKKFLESKLLVGVVQSYYELVFMLYLKPLLVKYIERRASTSDASVTEEQESMVQCFLLKLDSILLDFNHCIIPLVIFILNSIVEGIVLTYYFFLFNKDQWNEHMRALFINIVANETCSDQFDAINSCDSTLRDINTNSNSIIHFTSEKESGRHSQALPVSDVESLINAIRRLTLRLFKHSTVIMDACCMNRYITDTTHSKGNIANPAWCNHSNFAINRKNTTNLFKNLRLDIKLAHRQPKKYSLYE